MGYGWDSLLGWWKCFGTRSRSGGYATLWRSKGHWTVHSKLGKVMSCKFHLNGKKGNTSQLIKSNPLTTHERPHVAVIISPSSATPSHHPCPCSLVRSLSFPPAIPRTDEDGSYYPPLWLQHAPLDFCIACSLISFHFFSNVILLGRPTLTIPAIAFHHLPLKLFFFLDRITTWIISSFIDCLPH